MRELALDDIEALAVGAWILGTGGGGSPYLGLLNMRRLYAAGHRVSLMSPLDLADEDWVAVVSNMGAPLVGQERLADSRSIARAVEIQEGLLGAKFHAVMPLEIGGSNGIQQLMAAAHLGVPVVDADTMGAYPEAQMTSVAVGDLRPYPCVLCDPLTPPLEPETRTGLLAPPSSGCPASQRPNFRGRITRVGWMYSYLISTGRRRDVSVSGSLLVLDRRGRCGGPNIFPYNSRFGAFNSRLG
jgi:hypothetical protein